MRKIIYPLLIIVLFVGCDRDKELDPLDQSEIKQLEIHNQFFEYDGTNREVLWAIDLFRNQPNSNDLTKALSEKLGFPQWNHSIIGIKKSVKKNYEASESSEEVQSEIGEQEILIPMVSEEGGSVNALLLYRRFSNGEETFRIADRSVYDNLTEAQLMQRQSLLVASYLLKAEKEINAVESITIGGLIFRDAPDSNYGDVEPWDYGLMCTKKWVINANTGDVIAEYWVDCVPEVVVRPNDPLSPNSPVTYYDGVDGGGYPDTNYNDPIYYDNDFYRTGGGGGHTDYTGGLEDYLDSPKDDLGHNPGSEMIQSGPSGDAKDVLASFMTLTASELIRYPDTQEVAYSLSEAASDPSLTAEELHVLAYMGREVYLTAQSVNFKIDDLHPVHQMEITRNAAFIDFYPEVKKQINESRWPLSTQEWEALWGIFKPLIGELLIEAVPGGGLTLAFKDLIEGANKMDAVAITAGIVGIVTEFFPPGKVFKTVWRTGRVVRKGFKFVKYGRKYLDEIGLALEKGLKADVDGSIIRISKNGDEVARVTNNVLTFKYTGFGGDIVTVPNKTTTVIGKWENQIENIWNAGLAKQGSNKGGMNILGDLPNGTVDEKWEFNRAWLDDAIFRKDIIRLTADPVQTSNILYLNPQNLNFNNFSQVADYMTSFGTGSPLFDNLGFFGKEVHTLISSGYQYNSLTKQFFKP